MEITGKLKNAKYYGTKAAQFLIGNVYNDVRGKYQDGEEIRSSPIVSYSKSLGDDGLYITKTSTWDVEFDKDFIKGLKDNVVHKD